MQAIVDKGRLQRDGAGKEDCVPGSGRKHSALHRRRLKQRSAFDGAGLSRNIAQRSAFAGARLSRNEVVCLKRGQARPQTSGSQPDFGIAGRKGADCSSQVAGRLPSSVGTSARTESTINSVMLQPLQNAASMIPSTKSARSCGKAEMGITPATWGAPDPPNLGLPGGPCRNL